MQARRASSLELRGVHPLILLELLLSALGPPLLEGLEQLLVHLHKGHSALSVCT